MFVFQRKTFIAMQLTFRGGKKLNLRLSEKQALGTFKVIGVETAVNRAVPDPADEAADQRLSEADESKKQID